MANKQTKGVNTNVLVEQMQLQLQALQDEKNGLAKQVTKLKTAVTRQTTKINKLETTIATNKATISDLKAQGKDRATIISNREAELDATIKEFKEKLAAKGKEFEGKLAVKERELAVATARNNEAQKKVAQLPWRKSIHPAEPANGATIPKKRTHEEATGFSVLAWEQHFEEQLEREHHWQIHSWREEYERAELLEGSLRPQDAEKQANHKKEAAAMLQSLKQRIIVKNRRAQELRDLQSSAAGKTNAVKR